MGAYPEGIGLGNDAENETTSGALALGMGRRPILQPLFRSAEQAQQAGQARRHAGGLTEEKQCLTNDPF